MDSHSKIIESYLYRARSTTLRAGPQCKPQPKIDGTLTHEAVDGFESQIVAELVASVGAILRTT
jgi:hypothetical protein